jgi:MFS family permease
VIRGYGVAELAGATRALAGGILATALAVYVGRDGSPLAVSALSTVLFAATMVCTPLWGALGDVTGRRRRLLVVASVGASLAAGAFVIVRTVWPTVGVRAVYAAFAVGVSPLLLSLVRVVAGPVHRDSAAGRYSGAIAAGDVVAQLSVGVLIGTVARSTVLLLAAGVSLVGTLVVPWVRDPVVGTGGTDWSPRTLTAGVRDRLVPSRTERAALRAAGLTWLFAGLVVRHAAVRGVGALVPLYLLAEVGVSELVMGLLLTVAPAGQVVCMPAFGRLADRGGGRWTVLVGFLASAAYPPLLAAAAVVADGVDIGAAIAPVPPVIAGIGVATVGLLAVGVGFSGIDVGTIAVVGSVVAPDRESAFLGMRATVGGLGGVLGPLLVGAGVVIVGYQLTFLAAGGAGLLAGLVVARRLPERLDAGPAGDEWMVIPRIETALGIPRPLGQSRQAESPADDGTQQPEHR